MPEERILIQLEGDEDEWWRTARAIFLLNGSTATKGNRVVTDILTVNGPQNNLREVVFVSDVARTQAFNLLRRISNITIQDKE